MDIEDRVKETGINKLVESLDVGEPTLLDIIKELRSQEEIQGKKCQAYIKTGLINMEDLTPGLILKGTVRNVADFGAFVDIGVHQDGLVHKSQMANRFIKHPLEVVKVGDVVDVKILEVDVKRKRISLSMKEL